MAYKPVSFYYIFKKRINTMAVLKQRCNMPKEVIDYLNTYPAFMTGPEPDRGIIDAVFWIRVFSGICTSAELDDCHPMHKFCLAIWSGTPYMDATIEDARKFLLELEPIWCKFKDIESSGFFDNEFETFGEDDLLDI